MAAAANPLDLKIASGTMQDYFPAALPYVLGTDFSGRIAEAAAGWRAGDPVIGRLDPVGGGAFAEQIVIDAAQLVPAPSGVSLATAAGLPTAAATAWQALVEVANVQSGQTVLVHAAAGASAASRSRSPGGSARGSSRPRPVRASPSRKSSAPSPSSTTARAPSTASSTESTSCSTPSAARSGSGRATY